MKIEADYYRIGVKQQEDGGFRWVVYGYYNEQCRPGLSIEGTEPFPTEAEAREAGVIWSAANLQDAQTVMSH